MVAAQDNESSEVGESGDLVVDKSKILRWKANSFYNLDMHLIDIKLQNMMQFMNDFAVNFQTSLRDSSATNRPPTSESGAGLRPTSAAYKIQA